MLNVTIEAENSKLKVCYSSEIGKTTAIRQPITETLNFCAENCSKPYLKELVNISLLR